MLLGKTDHQKIKKFVEKKQRAINQVVPKKVFAWLPVRVENQQLAWLQKVWRVGYDISTVCKMKYKYFLTKESALQASLSFNASPGYIYREEVLKCLNQV